MSGVLAIARRDLASTFLVPTGWILLMMALAGPVLTITGGAMLAYHKPFSLVEGNATLIAVQKHCVKNGAHLIVALIQHTFTQLLPMPKPEGQVVAQAEDA